MPRDDSVRCPALVLDEDAMGRGRDRLSASIARDTGTSLAPLSRMSKQHKTLAFHRETILQLTPHQLGGVHGGTSDSDSSSSSAVDGIADAITGGARVVGAFTRGVGKVAGRITAKFHHVDADIIAGLNVPGIVHQATQITKGIGNQIAHNKPVNKIHTAVIIK